jgi:hypothetical protein
MGHSHSGSSPLAVSTGVRWRCEVAERETVAYREGAVKGMGDLIPLHEMDFSKIDRLFIILFRLGFFLFGVWGDAEKNK